MGVGATVGVVPSAGGEAWGEGWVIGVLLGEVVKELGAALSASAGVWGTIGSLLVVGLGAGTGVLLSPGVGVV